MALQASFNTFLKVHENADQEAFTDTDKCAGGMI